MQLSLIIETRSPALGKRWWVSTGCGATAPEAPPSLSISFAAIAARSCINLLGDAGACSKLAHVVWPAMSGENEHRSQLGLKATATVPGDIIVLWR